MACLTVEVEPRFLKTLCSALKFIAIIIITYLAHAFTPALIISCEGLFLEFSDKATKKPAMNALTYLHSLSARQPTEFSSYITNLTIEVLFKLSFGQKQKTLRCGHPFIMAKESFPNCGHYRGVPLYIFKMEICT